MSTFTQLSELNQWDEVYSQSKQIPVLVFKHSTTCPISANAFAELKRFSETPAAAGVKIAVVHVREDRAVSNHIADQLQVKHESPQAILLSDGKVLWHDSHWNITVESLQKAVEQ
ncbi:MULTISPECIES: bacillithiol system redox-active protein YtxJ [Thermoactinomyces]|jgi:bacillithiol system protein YtxJ|uniref:Bacillithiol system redox-active protein YtxJ n=1 Tax=Thermoactinomyces daqus TaxID=1329516 RepID=A0A7W1XBN2_9BACL|nr:MULTISPECIES: bacillithiol system redox-active protein YtxJ [Thermoactinomyces]MBA4543665.1 bacillithiol system redox-active protein YtxJ [Thermoactinomyces daqus]MBH8597116.1 bacillithiol system redox-active protein YtxJ [Thermoactinomyces sp. CICC 10523]MBH8602676.1 bacillithiol system redox-active protein YtxJ [Thermoactinomyces sp. CICC 10522]MBH8606213.1 bacillithiol system redox-active protein YtxJ [Thermoactinomyces sp. CICC 10521]